MERLKDEVLLLELASAVQDYFQNAADREESKDHGNKARLKALRSRAARIAGCIATHMYYKSKELVDKMEELTGKTFSNKTLT